MKNKPSMDSLKQSIKNAADPSPIVQEVIEDSVIAKISDPETDLTVTELNELYNLAFTLGLPCTRHAIAEKMRSITPTNRFERTVRDCVAVHKSMAYAPVWA